MDQTLLVSGELSWEEFMQYKRALIVTEVKDNSGHEHDFIGTVGGEVIGRAELLIDKEKNEAEFRIHLLPEWQSKGYGYELTKSTVEKGLTYLNRIWLGFEEENYRAQKLYESVGFKYTVHRMEIHA